MSVDSVQDQLIGGGSWDGSEASAAPRGHGRHLHGRRNGGQGERPDDARKGGNEADQSCCVQEKRLRRYKRRRKDQYEGNGKHV